MINPKERRQPKTWPFITLAEAVTWLALRRYVSKETLHRLDRFHRRRFGTLKPEVPQELQKKLEATERKLERWIRGQRVRVWGRLQRSGDEEQATRTLIPQEFLGVGVYLEYRSDSMIPDMLLDDNFASGLLYPCYRAVQFDGGELVKAAMDAINTEDHTFDLQVWVEQWCSNHKGELPTQSEIHEYFAQPRSLGRAWVRTAVKALPEELQRKRGAPPQTSPNKAL